MRFDLLVVGEGLAALTMLLHLPASIKVGVISRSKYNEPSSYWAQGGISAVFSAEDNIEKHVQDTSPLVTASAANRLYDRSLMQGLPFYAGSSIWTSRSRLKTVTST